MSDICKLLPKFPKMLGNEHTNGLVSMDRQEDQSRRHKKITTNGKHNHQYDDGVARNRAYVPGILSEVAARYKKANIEGDNDHTDYVMMTMIYYGYKTT